MMNSTMWKNFHRNDGDMAVDEILSAIRDGKWAPQVNNLRQALADGDTPRAETLKKTLPAFTFSATYGEKRRDECLLHYNAVVMLDVDKQPPGLIPRLKERAASDPQTLFCFLSPSGNGLKIGVRPAGIPHEMTPATHRQTFEAVKTHYEALLGVPIDPSGKDTGRLCFVSYDPEAFIAPERLQEPAPPVPPPVSRHLFSLARRCTNRKLKYEYGSRNNYVFLFSTHCRSKGIPPAEVETYCLKSFPDMDPKEVASTIHSAYAGCKEGQAEAAAGKPCKKNMTGEMITKVKNYLNEKCQFRYNVVTSHLEIRKKRTKAAFKQLNDKNENTLWVAVNTNVGNCSTQDLHAILLSDFSEDYDPFLWYFNALPAWDGRTDYIQQLADTVETNDQSLWSEHLKKWIVAAVACVMIPEQVNHTVLILCGDQGVGKTRWLLNLVPPELRDYVYSGVLDPRSKDHRLALSECFMVLLDEMGSLHPKDMDRMKELITTTYIRERRSYRRNSESYGRRASLVGSSNNHQMLSDPTGLRRYLCHVVKKIDYLSPVNYAGVYSQALALVRSGFKYWFDGQDIERLNAANEYFRASTPEEQFFHTYFRKPTEDDGKNGRAVCLSTAEILDRICFKTHLQMTHGGTIRLGHVLKKEDIEFRNVHNKKLYRIVEKTTEEVEAEKNRQPDTRANPPDTQANLPF